MLIIFDYFRYFNIYNGYIPLFLFIHWIQYYKKEGIVIMYEDEFPLRLAQLRAKKGVSARDMSLSLGQNAGYINNIESGKALPSMGNFFYICEYLDITPSAFFDINSDNPKELLQLIQKLKKLDENQLTSISTLVDGIIGSR